MWFIQALVQQKLLGHFTNRNSEMCVTANMFPKANLIKWMWWENKVERQEASKNALKVLYKHPRWHEYDVLDNF